MTKFFNKSKKHCFWPILGKLHPENLAVPYTTSYGFLSPHQNLEKTTDAIPRKCPNRQKV